MKNWPGTGWNVKPGKLLEMLDAGHDEAIWIDADIVAHHDFRPLIAGLSPETFVFSQELRGVLPNANRFRTMGFGLEPVRELPRVVDSGVIRVTQHDRPLLERWQELMASPA